MTPEDEALASVANEDHITLRGKNLSKDVKDALTDATVALTNDGAPTLTLTLEDADRAILNSDLLAKGLIFRVDGYPFELVQVAKSGPNLTVTLEHEVVAALRRHNSPVKAKPGTVTHLQFAKQLVSEEKWIQFVGPTGFQVPKVLTAITRGQPGSGKKLQPETTWDALVRNAGDRGWRVFVRGASQLWYVPDPWLIKRKAMGTVKPGANGVDDIDFDHDIGKKVATATVTARSSRWGFPIGEVVTADDVGVANGNWLVATIDRSLYSVNVSVGLTKPQPVLPEPKPSATAGSKSSSSGTIHAPGNVDTGAGKGSPSVNDFVNLALSEKGKPYVWGAVGPTSFDCSGLVEYCAHQVGLSAVPRTSGEQYEYCAKSGTTISVDKAEHVRGALLFEGSSGSQHVVISLGDGTTIEARGAAYGVGSFSAAGRPWSGAALLPGLRY